MKFTENSTDKGFLSLIKEIKEEIEMLKKHHKPTSEIDKAHTLLFHNSPKNEHS